MLTLSVYILLKHASILAVMAQSEKPTLSPPNFPYSQSRHPCPVRIPWWSPTRFGNERFDARDLEPAQTPSSAEQSGRATEPMGWRYRTTCGFLVGMRGGIVVLVTFFCFFLFGLPACLPACPSLSYASFWLLPFLYILFSDIRHYLYTKTNSRKACVTSSVRSIVLRPTLSPR